MRTSPSSSSNHPPPPPPFQPPNAMPYGRVQTRSPIKSNSASPSDTMSHGHSPMSTMDHHQYRFLSSPPSPFSPSSPRRHTYPFSAQRMPQPPPHPDQFQDYVFVNIIYSPPHSPRSPPSSPPPLNYALSPYAHIPLPSQRELPLPNGLGVRLHPVLVYQAPPQHTPSLASFDMSNSVHRVHLPRMKTHYLNQPATVPSVPSLSMWCPTLSRHIVVHRSGPEGVTVFDVWREIRRHMRMQIGMEGIVVDEDDLAGGPQPGTKVTLYAGNHWFYGLSRSCEAEDSFVLHSGPRRDVS